MSSTRTPLTGNPLAVFTDARGLTDKEMQLWREMNLSSLTVEPGIKDQIIGSSFWREAKSPSRTGIARASGSVEPTARREARALPSRIRKCRRLPLSKQIFELLDGQTSITHNCGHCVGIDWIVAWHHNSYRALRHEDVLPLSIYLEAGLFERFDGAQMIYAGKLRD